MLLLISFFTVTVFIFAGQGLVSWLWGVPMTEISSVMQNFDNPQAIRINRLMLLFQHLGLFVVPAMLFAQLSSPGWTKYLRFNPMPGKYLWGSVALIFLGIPTINALAWLNGQMVLPEFLETIERLFQSLEENAADLTAALTETGDMGDLLANLFVIAFLASLGEEMIFRGLLLPIFARWTGSKHLGVWISAVLFSAMHLQFYGFLPRLVLGALLGYLFLWSRSIWAPIVAHFTNNAWALIGIFLVSRGEMDADVDSFQPVDQDWKVLGITLAIAAILMVWLSVNRKPAGGSVDIDD